MHEAYCIRIEFDTSFLSDIQNGNNLAFENPTVTTMWYYLMII